MIVPKKDLDAAAARVSRAFAECRRITRGAARNFYYGFLALPRDRRDALCAVYAFMRHSDDLSDDPGLTSEERRRRLEAWRSSLHAAIAGEPTEHPVLLALAVTQHHFRIPLEWLDKLVQGTEMDVAQNASAIRYRNFEELRRYCDHVASVVGLISIRIFGYSDPRAEELAERCGIAFQLTNIIRDVREDAAMGRVYLPEEDLARFGRSAAELAPARVNNGFDPAGFRPVLEFEAQRAREYYKAADELLPLIDAESRPALWVLVEIYRRLLEKIAASGYDVFHRKVRLSTAEKLAVLSRGMWRRITA